MTYDLTRPCAECPFRNDRPGYLSRGRPAEIAAGVRAGGEFPCHKTTKFEDGDEGEVRVPGDHEHACAGALILMEKDGGPNQMARIVERLGLYDHTQLDMTAPVYATWAEFVRKAVEPRRKK